MKTIESPWIEQEQSGETGRITLAGALLGAHCVVSEPTPDIAVVSYANDMKDENGELPEIPQVVIDVVTAYRRAKGI